MSQQFSKLQANAPPKPPDVATGLMPARVQRLDLGSQTPHSSCGQRTEEHGPFAGRMGGIALQVDSTLGMGVPSGW